LRRRRNASRGGGEPPEREYENKVYHFAVRRVCDNWGKGAWGVSK